MHGCNRFSLVVCFLPDKERYKMQMFWSWAHTVIAGMVMVGFTWFSCNFCLWNLKKVNFIKMITVGFVLIACSWSDAFLAGDRLRRRTTDCRTDKTRAKILKLASGCQKPILHHCWIKHWRHWVNLDWNLPAPSLVYINLSENWSGIMNITFLQQPW